MPRRLYACTPTRLTTWLDCPRRYRFSYLDRPTPPKGPPWAHNSLGSSVHNALRSWWDVPLERRTPQAAGSLVESGWLTDGYRDEAQSASVRARARAMVERYVARLDPADEPRAVERTVATKTERLALSGRVDRIDERVGEDGPELVVVDYKTGRRPLVESEARGSLALAMYVLGARRTLRAAARRVELHHLPTDDVQGFDHTEESLGRHLQRAEAIADEASAADAVFKAGEVQPAELDAVFPARPGALCGWCDFQRQCPQGLAASRPKRPWDAVEEMSLE
jgi:RecB family exonuclease